MDTRCIGYSGYCVDNAAVWALNTSQYYFLQQHTLPDGGEVSSSLPPPPTRSVFSGGGNVVAETGDKHTLGRRKRGHNITAREPPSRQAGVRRGRHDSKTTTRNKVISAERNRNDNRWQKCGRNVGWYADTHVCRVCVANWALGNCWLCAGGRL